MNATKNKKLNVNGPLKEVFKVLPGMPTSDGAGVKLTRALGQGGLKNIDPFLMLDEIRSDVADDYIAGFPPHPHKGFETLTYMIQGSMEHNDSTGGSGLISSGGVQYMTAGKGIIHSETPKQDSGLMFGFQLWINLAAKDKLQEPNYVDIPPEQIEVVKDRGARVKVIAGQLDAQQLTFADVNDEGRIKENLASSQSSTNYALSDVRKLSSKAGPVKREDINMQMYDVSLVGSEALTLSFDKLSQGFIYVYQGAVEINGKVINEKQIVGLRPSDTTGLDPVGNEVKESVLLSKIKADDEVGLLVLMGNPINEPIVQYGPFVMNTMKEIDVALKDYQSGNFV